MTRRKWEAGLSRLAVAGFVAQGIFVAALLGVAALLLHSQGWFSDAHDRALLWDDVTVATGLICGVPLLSFLIRKRSSAVALAAVMTVVVCTVLLALRPNQG